VALAQDKPTAIGIGYQLVNSDDLLFPIGLNLDASAGLTRRVAVVGEASWSRSSSQQFGLRDITTVLAAAAGVRWSLSPDRRLSPFAQMLVGLERERSDVERFGVDWTSSALLQPGVGGFVRMTKRQDLFGEVDWRRVPQQSDRTSSLGVVFGGRFRSS